MPLCSATLSGKPRCPSVPFTASGHLMLARFSLLCAEALAALGCRTRALFAVWISCLVWGRVSVSLTFLSRQT